MPPNEDMRIRALVVLGLCVAAVYLFVRWLRSGPSSPNPWDAQVDDALASSEATPICQRCFAPQDHAGWFCPECGTTVGPYVNYLPYINVFPQGEILRTGTSGQFRRSKWIIGGYLLFSLGSYSILAPIYWFFLFRNLNRQSAEAAKAETPA